MEEEEGDGEGDTKQEGILRSSWWLRSSTADERKRRKGRGGKKKTKRRRKEQEQDGEIGYVRVLFVQDVDVVSTPPRS